MNPTLQPLLQAPHVGATKEIWDAINVDLQQIVDDMSCWEGANAERMCNRLEEAINRLNAAVGHEREGYESSIASSFEVEALKDRCEKLDIVIATSPALLKALTRLLASCPGIAGATDAELQQAANDPEQTEELREQAGAVLAAREAIQLTEIPA